MSVLKLLQKHEVRPVKAHALIVEITKAITWYSERKRIGGQEPLNQSVSFSFLDKSPIAQPRRFFQRRGSKTRDTKPSNVAWLVGILRSEGTPRLYVGRNGHGYLTRTLFEPRVPYDVRLVTPEMLFEEMSYSQLEEILTLLTRSRK